MKIFFVVPQVTHYRETFYEKLIGTFPQHEWLIIDGEKKKDDGRPTYYKKFNFPHKRFEEKSKKVGPFTIRDYIGLTDFIKEHRPALVIMPSIAGTISFRKIAKLARQNKTNLILWSCLWEHAAVKRSAFSNVKNWFLKRFLNSAHFHIAYSSYAEKKLIKNGFPGEKIFIAYNGLELDGMEKKSIDKEQIGKVLQELNIVKKERVFLYVGGLGADKNVMLLLQAVLQLSNASGFNNYKVIIIGDGPEKSNLEDFVEKNRLSDVILFLGRIVDNVDQYFQIADCFVLPGAGGLGLNQAMYWQKPCIVSHADGTELDLIFNNKTGFIFEENNAASLYKSMELFLTLSDDKIKEMGEAAHEIVTTQSNVNKMVDVFANVIELNTQK